MRRLAAALLVLSSAARCLAGDVAAVEQRRDADFAAGQPMVAHVIVALCDNESQGIVPVPPALGNGDDPRSNLYWGAMYGVRSWFKRSPHWKGLPLPASGDPRILDRVLFRREVTRDGRKGEVLLLAEAWQGRHIAEAISRFLKINRGEDVETVSVAGQPVMFGGAAHLTAFVGHNGLMDFAAPTLPRSRVETKPQASVVLACMSDSYFSSLLSPRSIPLLMTSGLMAPEAYTLDAAISSWFSGEGPVAVELAAARAYARHQKASERAALRLFVAPTGGAHP